MITGIATRKKVAGGVEHRQDPLFGSWTRINPDRALRVKHTGETSRGKDLQRLIETSREQAGTHHRGTDPEMPEMARGTRRGILDDPDPGRNRPPGTPLLPGRLTPSLRVHGSGLSLANDSSKRRIRKEGVPFAFLFG